MESGAASNIHSSDIVDLLSRGDTYPGRTASVSMLETHISWVFLTDGEVYKVKKPVEFEFLDFREPRARRAACDAEVRLNRRLTDGIYIDVLPIVANPSGDLTLGGAGTPVDWVVHMRRLPEDRFLETLIRSRSLSDAGIESLVQRLTAFYRVATPVLISPDDYHSRLVQHVLANQHDLDKHQGVLPAFLVHRIHGAQLQFLSLRQELFAARVRAGRIIEGHGDLRPEHICLTTPVQIFDCVEFSLELRSLDVADELSFLDLECEMLGDDNVGRRVFAAYSQTNGDFPAAPLVAFYKSYRAVVRAKVALLRADQLTGGARTDAYQRARAYLELAERYAQQLGTAVLIVVRGLSGSGKTTLASEVATRLGAELLGTDTIRRELSGWDPQPSAFGAGRYSLENRRRVYEEMFRRAAPYLAHGVSVVLDGTHLALSERHAALALGQRHGAGQLIVNCQCDPEVARRRIADRLARGVDMSDALPEVYDRQLEFEEDTPGDLPSMNVDTTQSLSAQLEQVIHRLSSLSVPETVSSG